MDSNMYWIALVRLNRGISTIYIIRIVRYRPDRGKQKQFCQDITVVLLQAHEKKLDPLRKFNIAHNRYLSLLIPIKS